MRFKHQDVLYILCLVSITHAKNKTETKQAKLEKKRLWFNKIKQQLLVKTEELKNSSNERAFSGVIGRTVTRLNEYGCWCYFFDNVGRGAGQPVDVMDGFCKVLADGYACAISDFEQNEIISNNFGRSCVPWESSYNPGTGIGEELRTSCDALNSGNLCDSYACAVEGQFVDSLFDFLLSGNEPNYRLYSHDYSFNHVSQQCCDAAAFGGIPPRRTRRRGAVFAVFRRVIYHH